MTAIDKHALFGEYQRSARQYSRLHRMGIAKGLDLPWNEDDMENNARYGITGWQLLGIVGVIVAGLLFYGTSQKHAPTITPPATAVQPHAQQPPAKPQEFRITFWAEDGTELELDNDSQ